MTQGQMIWIIIAFAAYMMMMIGIGAIYMKRTSNSADYFLGGRGLGAWVAALSAQASDMSGWLLMGLPGAVYALGTGQSWIAIGLLIGTILNWIFISGRLRRYTIRANNSLTLPAYFENRFHDKKRVLLSVSSVVIVIFFLVYTASALAAGGKLFHLVFGLDYRVSLTIGAAVILLYTFMGGFMAVCVTDFIQGMLMLVGLLAVPLIAYGIVGPGNLASVLEASGVAGGSASFLNLLESGGKAYTPVEIFSQLAWGFGYCGMPHILVRFMAIEKPSMVKKSATIAIGWVVLSLGATIAFAILGRTYLLSDGSSLAAALLPDGRASIFITIVQDLFPGFIAGLLLAAIVAAAMSTADSQLLVASSSFTSDIYKPLIRKGQASDSEVGMVGRIVVVVISVIAYLIAASGTQWASDIMAMVENAWGLFGAAFGPVVILSLFWKRFNFPGAVAGIIGGAVVDIVWLLWIKASTGIFEILPGFVAGLVIAVIVSLATKAPGAEVEAIFAAATDPEIDE